MDPYYFQQAVADGAEAVGRAEEAAGPAEVVLVDLEEEVRVAEEPVEVGDQVRFSTLSGSLPVCSESIPRAYKKRTTRVG